MFFPHANRNANHKKNSNNDGGDGEMMRKEYNMLLAVEITMHVK